jgi:hypothetical protein
MTRRELLASFELSNRDFLECEVYEYQRRLAFRPADTGDGVQLELAIERLATFNAMMSAINTLLNMRSAVPDVVQYIALDKDVLKSNIEAARARIKRVPEDSE